MRKLVAAAGLGVTVILAGGGWYTSASAAAVKPAVNWTQRTCTAFAAYQAHPSSAAFRVLVTDSAYLPKSYLKADVLQWAADSASPSPKAAVYAAKDPVYVGEDCAS
jgi:hypothetical protein